MNEEFCGIVTADWHLRKDKPICRADDGWDGVQRSALMNISRTYYNYRSEYGHKMEIAVIGDLFHTARQPYEVFLWFYEIFADENIKTLAGNHDLLHHSWDNLDKSIYGLVDRIFPQLKGTYAGAFNFCDTPNFCDIPKEPRLMFLHRLVFPDKGSQIVIDGKPVGQTAEELLDEFPNAEWIFLGDYHHAFHVERGGRHVVNPGCITRQVADMKDYKPLVYFVDTASGKVEEIFLPDCDPDKVTDDHLKNRKESNARLDAFVEQVKGRGDVTLDFDFNLEKKLQGQRPEVVEAVEEIKSYK